MELIQVKLFCGTTEIREELLSKGLLCLPQRTPIQFTAQGKLKICVNILERMLLYFFNFFLSFEFTTLIEINFRVVGTQNAHNLISVSTDGRLCSWSLDMLSAPQETLELQVKIHDAYKTN